MFRNRFDTVKPEYPPKSKPVAYSDHNLSPSTCQQRFSHSYGDRHASYTNYVLGFYELHFIACFSKSGKVKNSKLRNSKYVVTKFEVKFEIIFGVF